MEERIVEATRCEFTLVSQSNARNLLYVIGALFISLGMTSHGHSILLEGLIAKNGMSRLGMMI